MLDPTRTAFVDAVAAHRVASRFVQAFKVTPMMSQVKKSLATLEVTAKKCERSISSFKEAVESACDEFSKSGFEVKTPPECYKSVFREYKEIEPTVNTLRSIAKSDLGVDDVEDIRKAGIDLVALAKKIGAHYKDRKGNRNPDFHGYRDDEERDEATISICGHRAGEVGKELQQLAAEFLQEELPPLPWWIKNLEQTNMLAELHVETAEDKDLVAAVKDLIKTIQNMFKVGASLDGALKSIQGMIKRVMDAIDDVELPAESPFKDYETKERKDYKKTPKPRGPAKPKKPTFEEARKVIFERLQKEGWKFSPLTLKIPHATSPDGRNRLWFKAWAVYMNDKGAQPNDPKRTHSITSDLRDFADPDKFMQMVEHRMQ